MERHVSSATAGLHPPACPPAAPAGRAHPAHHPRAPTRAAVGVESRVVAPPQLLFVSQVLERQLELGQLPHLERLHARLQLAVHQLDQRLHSGTGTKESGAGAAKTLGTGAGRAAPRPAGSPLFASSLRRQPRARDQVRGEQRSALAEQQSSCALQPRAASLHGPVPTTPLTGPCQQLPSTGPCQQLPSHSRAVSPHSLMPTTPLTVSRTCMSSSRCSTRPKKSTAGCPWSSNRQVVCGSVCSSSHPNRRLQQLRLRQGQRWGAEGGAGEITPHKSTLSMDRVTAGRAHNSHPPPPPPPLLLLPPCRSGARQQAHPASAHMPRHLAP